jgi:hypothetical protein
MITIHENVTLIECADDLAMEELAGAVGLETCVVQRLSSRAVIVDPESVEGLLQRMQRKGYTPRILSAKET